MGVHGAAGAGPTLSWAASGVGTSWTLCGWIRFTTAVTCTDAAVLNSGNGNFVDLDRATAPQANASGYGPTALAGTWTTATWFFWALRSDGTTGYTSMAKKGDVALTSVTGSVVGVTVNPDTVGAFGIPGGAAQSSSDRSNCMFWNSKLSDAQLISQMSSFSPLVTPLAWWKMVSNATRTVDSQTFGGTNRPLTSVGTFTDATDPTDWWPPSISVQPQSQSVAAGYYTTLTVTATSGVAGSLTYQWKKNGNTITGATSSSYQTEALLMSDNQSYYTVDVTDSNGTQVSDRAYVIVSAPIPYVLSQALMMAGM